MAVLQIRLLIIQGAPQMFLNFVIGNKILARGYHRPARTHESATLRYKW